MTDPTLLRPAAQAVETAVLRVASVPGLERRRIIAAVAVRAVADQVVPYEAAAPWNELKCDYDGDHWEMRQWVRDQLLAIAAELEGTNV